MSDQNDRAAPKSAGTPHGNAANAVARLARMPLHVAAPIVVTLAVGAVVLVSGWRTLRPAPVVDVSPVVVRQASAPARTGRFADPAEPAGSGVTVQAPGWLEADPYYIACTALADGVIEQILVLEGEPVEMGQIVARLVSEDAELALARAEAELDAARAELDVARAALHAAETEWDNPVERTRSVETARAALAETEAELIQLDPEIAAEQAILRRLEEERDRARAAVETGATNEIELIRREQEAAAQRGRLEATRARREILQARRDRLVAELRAAEENLRLRITERRALDEARARVALARATVSRAEAARDEAALRLERMTIRSPITGFVQARLKVPGDKVRLATDDPKSAHVLHVYDPASIQVRVDVPLADAAHVFVGQRCRVIVEVLPDTEFDGVVTRVTHEADVQKNTLQVKVAVTNPSALLRPEMLTRVKFLPGPGAASPTETSSDSDAGASGAFALLVPTDALESADQSGATHVWVVRDRRADRGRAHRVSVRLDPAHNHSSEHWVRALDGARAGDLVIATPRPTLRDGQPVRLAPATPGAPS